MQMSKYKRLHSGLAHLVRFSYWEELPSLFTFHVDDRDKGYLQVCFVLNDHCKPSSGTELDKVVILGENTCGACSME